MPIFNKKKQQDNILHKDITDLDLNIYLKYNKCKILVVSILLPQGSRK